MSKSIVSMGKIAINSEGPEKVTREGVNGSRSKS
jgi:hypothetical protein